MTRNTDVPRRILTLLIAGCAAFLCAIFAVAMEQIRPVPDKLTRQKDAAELARIEARAQVAATELRDSPPAPASSGGIDRNQAEPKEHSPVKTREATLVDGHSRSVSPKTDSASREAKRQLKAWKHYQREQAIAAWRQRYAQQGSFFNALSRALGLSTQ
jgi:hypothetical protein